MTERDANFQVYLAGRRAADEAEKAGIAPEAAEALLDAASGGRMIGGVLFRPIHASLLLLLPQLDAFKEVYPALKNDAVGLMGIAWCVLDPDAARVAMRAKDLEKCEAALFDIGRRLTLPQLKDLGLWIASQMELLNDSGDASEAEAAEKK